MLAESPDNMKGAHAIAAIRLVRQSMSEKQDSHVDGTSNYDRRAQGSQGNGTLARKAKIVQASYPDHFH